MLRRCFRVALASVLLAPALLPLRVPAATTLPPPPAAAEEISLASLGFAAQVVHGPGPSLDIRFPPPAASLADSGSYLRVFYGHSAPVGLGSDVRVLVNGQLLDNVPLTEATAQGAVFVLEVPPVALHLDRANLVEFDFSVLAPTAWPDGPDLYGLVGAQTALHYRLRADGDTIEAYPYSLLGGSLFGSLADVPLGVVLRSAPDDQELAAALRMVADASRRLRGARLRATVVSEGQESWLQSARSPALIVGRVSGLPGAATLLRAAGFTSSPGGWTAPGATAPTAADAGIIAAVVSPWDGRSPMLLVTGNSDTGVARAAAAVLDSRQRVTGHEAVVSGLVGGGPADPPDLPLRTLLPEQLAVHGAGDHRLAVGVPLPAIAEPFAATVRLTASIAQSAAGGVDSPEVTLAVGGHAVGGPFNVLAPSLAATRELDIRGQLRPGMNAVTLNLRNTSEDVGTVRLATDLSNFQPLPAPGASSTFAQLPDPFLGAPGHTGPAVALSDLRPTTLAGAVAVMAALGSRAIVAPAPLSVLVLGTDQQVPRGANSVIVIGGRAGEALRLHSGAFRGEVLSPPTSADDAGSGWISEVRLPAGVSALWVGGDPVLLAATGRALANPTLRGQLAIVRPGGEPRSLLAVSPGSGIELLPLRLAYLLPMMAGVVLLGLLALEAARQWRRVR